MNWQMILAGFGGQGMMFLGQLLAYAAMEDDKNTTWIPSYGPEMRGGTANCSVVISSKKVNSPIVSRPNLLVAMNMPSLHKFVDSIKEGGYLFLNCSLADEEVTRKDIKVINIPANDLAGELGSAKIANMVVLGAIVGKTGCVEPASVYKILAKKVPASRRDLLDLNKKAIQVGMDYAANNS
ncbi:MAG: 2-oxoacid:acceptor oxidoreductase family protein [Peptococcaceae bacterium]